MPVLVCYPTILSVNNAASENCSQAFLPAAITSGFSSDSSDQGSVQAAGGATPGAQSSSDQTLMMGAGLKIQQLHGAQWNLDRIDQVDLPLNQTFM